MRDLSEEEKIKLAGLTYHEGFKVLQALMEEECLAATAAVLKCDPTDTARVSSLLAEARAKNAFSAHLLKLCAWIAQESTTEVEA